MTTTLVVLTVILIVLYVAALAFYLWVVGGQLTRVAVLLEECSGLVRKVESNADGIEPGLERINNTGRVIAGALPLLYGMGEGIVAGATYEPQPESAEPEPARPAMGTRRSRLHDMVGYEPEPLAPVS